MRVPALTLLSAAIFAPGTQQPAGEMTTRTSSATFRAVTNEVEVPVVVRDFKDRAVGSLTKDDFRIFDRGKPQTILKFTVEKSIGPDVIVPASPNAADKVVPVAPAIPAAVLPERFVAYLFDDVHVKPNDLAMARDAADRHTKKSLGPKTRAAIFTTSGQTMLDFTDDRAKWHEYLYRLQPLHLDRHEECLTFKMAFAIQHGWDKGPTGGGPPGTKAACRQPDPRAAAAQEIARTEYTTGISLDTLRDLVKRMSVLPGERTIVLASPGFITENVSKEWETIIDRAIHATVVINSIDLRGLYTDMEDMAEPHSPPGEALRQENKDRTDVMAELAYGTGGVFFHNNNDLDTGFDRVAANPEFRYILSFAPSDLKSDGSVHGLKVSIVPNPHHYDIVARTHYVAPLPLNDPIEAAREEIREALYSRDDIAGIAADMHPGFTRLGPAKARVTVPVHVGLDAFHFKKVDDRNAADLTVLIGLFDRNGNYVSGKATDVELRLKPENMDDWMRNGIKLGCNLEVAPGNYLVRLVVRDSEGRAMAAHNGSINIQ